MESGPAEPAPAVTPHANEHGFEVISASTERPNAGLSGGDMKGSSEIEFQASSKRLYEGGRDGPFIDWVEEMPEGLKNPGPDTESATKGFALLLRTQVINRKQKLHSIVIQSPLLRDALGDVLVNYPGVYLGSDPLIFNAPFRPFVHRWQQLVEASENHIQQESRQHLQLLKSTLEPELKESFAAIKGFAEYGAVEYRHLWAAFPPGCTVIAEQGKAVRAFKIRKTEYKEQEEGNFFFLHGYYVNWDGKSFGRALHVFAISEFEGSAGHSELPALPLEYHPDKEYVSQMLIERGRLFTSLGGICYKAYDGVGIDKTDFRVTPHHVSGRVVIDANTYFSRFPDQYIPLGPLQPTKSELDEDAGADNQDIPPPPPPPMRMSLSPPHFPLPMYRNEGQLVLEAMIKSRTSGSRGENKEMELSEEDLMICSHEVKGFSLKLKKWLELDVSLVKDIRWNDQAFDSLALPGDYKHLLLAFAKSQSTTADQFDDVIEGKGKGMVMLLEGPPGVGKTLTVESVAEEMRVPLYSISAGELGTEAREVHMKLNTAFENAVEWNAVILLDEADVFLEKRSIHDLQRNQLVSVFLQSLEYYRGTIFLTTNRISCIDPAFNSRIHISLPYPPLSINSRCKVWRNFLFSLNNVDATDVLREESLEQLAERDLNGRQIKNVVKMASLLAVTHGGELRMEHVETVMRIVGAEGAGAAFAE